MLLRSACTTVYNSDKKTKKMKHRAMCLPYYKPASSLHSKHHSSALCTLHQNPPGLGPEQSHPGKNYSSSSSACHRSNWEEMVAEEVTFLWVDLVGEDLVKRGGGYKSYNWVFHLSTLKVSDKSRDSGKYYYFSSTCFANKVSNNMYSFLEYWYMSSLYFFHDSRNNTEPDCTIILITEIKQELTQDAVLMLRPVQRSTLK